MKTASASPAINVALAWQRAANAHDIDGVIALSDENIEVGGPRGASRGHAVVRDWIARTGIGLEQLRVFERDGVVVVEQRATWKLGSASTSTRIIGTVFRVGDGSVTSIFRYDSIDQALAAAGLGLEDER